MENTPEAAAPATEAQPTNTTSAPAEAPAAPAEPAKADAPDLQGFTSEQLTEMKKFMDANGGYDKAFKTFKERISNPAPETPKEQPTTQPVQAQTTDTAQPQPMKTPAGFISQTELMAQNYYNGLAARPEYEAIADDIKSGEVFKEMSVFGIRPMDANGNINDAQVRAFLDLKAKTVPAKPAVSPEAAAAPTVDYVPVNDGKIESFSQAAQIIAQSQQLKSKGLAEHPDVAAAKEFIKNSLVSKKTK